MVLQTLTDMTDEEIQTFTAKAHKKILNLAKNKDAMLRTLNADEAHIKMLENPPADKVALMLYPELLRDGYNKEQLKETKKRMLQDAKSGAIKIANKRLFVIPDWYAFCQHLFLHDPRPCGLLQNGEVACFPLRMYEKADVLRSPSLYMEHAIRKIVKDSKIYEWFYTDAIATSCHDMISRILQFDRWSN